MLTGYSIILVQGHGEIGDLDVALSHPFSQDGQVGFDSIINRKFEIDSEV